jgi:hypothetical protein
MWTTGQQSSSHANGSSNGWLFRRQHQDPQAADFVLPEIKPYYPDRARNCTILAIVLLVLVVVVVSVSVDAPKNGGAQTTPYSPVVDQFWNFLPPYSKELAESEPHSPQAKALAWLRSDPLYYEYVDVYRLNQRYALAVLYYSTNGASWRNNSGWLSDANECSWYTSGADICGEELHLRRLDLNNNFLHGSIPTELELLTDSTLLYLNDDGLSGGNPFRIVSITTCVPLVFVASSHSVFDGFGCGSGKLTALRDLNLGGS